MPLKRIRTEGFERVIAKLEGIDLKANDLTVPLKKAGEVMMYSIESNFLQQGRPKPWAPLAASTVKRKAREGRPSMILQNTGQMRRQVSYVVDPMSLTVGVPQDYAKYHQFGTSKIPRRKFLTFQNQDLDDIKRLVNTYVQES